MKHWTHDQTVRGSSPGGRISSPVNFLCWLLCWYLSPPPPPPPCSGHSAKSTSGRLQLNTPAHYTRGFEWSDAINLCMVVWCTQNLHWDGSSFMWYQSNSSGYIQNMLWKVTHSQSHATSEYSESSESAWVLYKVSPVSLLECHIKVITNNHSHFKSGNTFDLIILPAKCTLIWWR